MSNTLRITLLRWLLVMAFLVNTSERRVAVRR
jgi:hypothetical protein